jgi:putative membrane protein
MKLLLHLVISTLAVLVAANILDGVTVDTTTTAVVVAIVLGILNSFVRPVLQILALPITILTLGLFYIVINVFMVYIAEFMIGGFAVDGFITALLFSIIVSLVSSVLGLFVK